MLPDDRRTPAARLPHRRCPAYYDYSIKALQGPHRSPSYCPAMVLPLVHSDHLHFRVASCNVRALQPHGPRQGAGASTALRKAQCAATVSIHCPVAAAAAAPAPRRGGGRGACTPSRQRPLHLHPVEEVAAAPVEAAAVAPAPGRAACAAPAPGRGSGPGARRGGGRGDCTCRGGGGACTRSRRRQRRLNTSRRRPRRLHLSKRWPLRLYPVEVAAAVPACKTSCFFPYSLPNVATKRYIGEGRGFRVSENVRSV